MDDRGQGQEHAYEAERQPGFAELVERAARGESEAAHRLVADYESSVRRQVRMLLLDNALRRVVEETDLCQSVLGQFFAALRSGGVALERPEQLIGLLRQMVRNKVTDQARYWRAGRRDLARRGTSAHLDDGCETVAVARDPSPSRQVEESDFLAAMEGRLDAWERWVFTQRRQGVSWPEIAASDPGGSGAEAIRKRFERALDRVLRRLSVA